MQGQEERQGRSWGELLLAPLEVKDEMGTVLGWGPGEVTRLSG